MWQSADADPASSRTALSQCAGRGKIGKEVAEEAIEVAFEAMEKNRDAVVQSGADLLFNLEVLWTSIEVMPKHVWKEMNRRAQLFGIAEKLAKPRGVPKARRKLGRWTSVCRSKRRERWGLVPRDRLAGADRKPP